MVLSVSCYWYDASGALKWLIYLNTTSISKPKENTVFQLEMLPIEKYNNIVKMKWSACQEGVTKKNPSPFQGFEPMISQTQGRRSTQLIYRELFLQYYCFFCTW